MRSRLEGGMWRGGCPRPCGGVSPHQGTQQLREAGEHRCRGVLSIDHEHQGRGRAQDIMRAMERPYRLRRELPDAFGRPPRTKGQGMLGTQHQLQQRIPRVVFAFMAGHLCIDGALFD